MINGPKHEEEEENEEKAHTNTHTHTDCLHISYLHEPKKNVYQALNQRLVQ